MPGGSNGYEIGYGRPPRASQFRKGRSGNPNGRPKGRNNLKTDLAQELAKTTQIRDGKAIVTVTKQQALIKTLVNGGVQGRPRMTELLIKTILQHLGSEEVIIDEKLFNQDELEVFESLKQRILQQLAERK